jgi:hypothetical protein
MSVEPRGNKLLDRTTVLNVECDRANHHSVSGPQQSIAWRFEKCSSGATVGSRSPAAVAIVFVTIVACADSRAHGG